MKTKSKQELKREMEKARKDWEIIRNERHKEEEKIAKKMHKYLTIHYK